MRPPENGSVTVRWTEIALRGSAVYGVSEEALTFLLAANPTCGLQRGDIKNLRCLPWAGQANQAAALTIWYIYVAEINHVEVIAISEQGDRVSEDNAEKAKGLTARIFGGLRNGYFGYRLLKEIADHLPKDWPTFPWHHFTDFLP